MGKSIKPSKWKFKGKLVKTLDDVPECCPFVVYTIRMSNGDFYIGSKQIYFTRRIKLSKKRSLELWKGKGPKPRFETVSKESDWKTYKSSSKLVQERLQKEDGEFEIINWFETKREMLLTEAKYIIDCFLKLDEKCLNSWINLKMFKQK